MNKTKMVSCTCQHAAQDEMHGKGIRVATPVNTQQKKNLFVVRCTVCGREHSLGDIA